MLQMVILAGGLATRLSTLELNIPKSLVPVAGRPFLDIQLELVQAHGIERVLILAGHLGEKIEEHIDQFGPRDMKISFSYDPEGKPLGTGGALKWAEPKLENDFFLIYGDSYLPIPLKPIEEFYFQHDCLPVQTVFKNRDKFDTSNIDIAGGKVIYYRKKPDRKVDFIDYGLMVLNKKVLASFERGVKFDLSELVKDLIAGNSLLAYETQTRFWEIGTVSGLKDLEKHLIQKER